MRKILVLGDIHIGDYPRYNGVANRLNQFNLLADCLIEKDYDDVIIAGDFLLGCVMKPRVMHVVKSFIDKLCNRFDNVYYILGNHDLDIKLKGFSPIDSLVTLLSDAKNFQYMNQKELVIEGVKFYFMDWINSHVIPIDKKCNIFISHVNVMPGFGREFDESMFDLGIMGDYHARYRTNKIITTGTPIQHYVSDPIEPKVLSLTIDEGKFSCDWVPIETEKYKFLKIYKEEDYPNDPTPYEVMVPGRKTPELTEDRKELKSKLDNNLDTIISEMGLTSIHSEIIQECGNINQLDLDFRLVSIDILNFKSISKLFLEFDERSVLFLQGHNGSGKTCLLKAIEVALYGDRSMRKYCKIGETVCELKIEIEYQNRIHRICRAQGWLGYSIDKVPIDANNTRALQEVINHNLPFLPYLRDFIINSRSSFFSSCNRIGLFTRLFGLDQYSKYIQKAGNIKNSVENKINSYTGDKTRIEGEMATYNNLIGQESDSLNGNSVTFEEVHQLASTISEYENSLIEYKYIEKELLRCNELLKYPPMYTQEQFDQQIQECELNIRELSKKSEGLSQLERAFKYHQELLNLDRATKMEVKCNKCNSVQIVKISSGNYESKLNEAKIEYNKLKDSIDTTKSQSELKASINDYDKKLLELRALGTKVTEYHINKSHEAKLLDRQCQLNNIYGSKDKLIADIEIAKELHRNYTKLISSKEKLDSYNNSLTELTMRLNEINSLLEKSLKELKLLDKYLELFSFSNINGIPYRSLNLLIESLSDEEINFTTYKESLGGKIQFKVSCEYNVDGNYLDFDELSDGQQAYVSLKILSKLSKCLPKIGMVTLDEPFKHVDEANITSCIKLLKDVNTNLIILSSHSPSFNYADRVMNFSLINGTSNITEG